MTSSLRASLFGLLIAAALSGCGVRMDIHEAALDTITHRESDLSDCRNEAADRAAEAELRLTACWDEVDALKQSRDALVTDNQRLRTRLADGAEGDRPLEEEHPEIEALLEESRRALADARERQGAAHVRDASLLYLRVELASKIDAANFEVRIDRGRLVIDLKQDLLFPPDSAALSDIGLETLREVASTLAQLPEHAFGVESHTDNLPLRTRQFASNWELSTARAVSVVTIFAERGLNPAALSATGYGEFQPRADNGSPEGRALNRRIEIVMRPNVQTLPDPVEAL